MTPALEIFQTAWIVSCQTGGISYCFTGGYPPLVELVEITLLGSCCGLSENILQGSKKD